MLHTIYHYKLEIKVWHKRIQKQRLFINTVVLERFIVPLTRTELQNLYLFIIQGSIIDRNKQH